MKTKPGYPGFINGSSPDKVSHKFGIDNVKTKRDIQGLYLVYLLTNLLTVLALIRERY